jgi:thiol-disulfide isomerase/thioredoxin
MLDQKYWGLPLWVWLVVVGIVFFSYYQTMGSVEAPKPNAEIKEKFSEVSSEDKTKIKVFNFNTSWCGWSRRFQPEWEEFSKRVKSEPKLSHVDAFDVKCDDDKNESMCEKYEVPGYPFVVVEINGKRTQYNGERTADALVKYVLQ